MFHWICPECGREIPPAVKECPACDPSATIEVPVVRAAEPPPVAEVKPVEQKPLEPAPVAAAVAAPVPVEPEPVLDPLLALAETVRAAQAQALEPPPSQVQPVPETAGLPQLASAVGVAEAPVEPVEEEVLVAVAAPAEPATPAAETKSQPVGLLAPPEKVEASEQLQLITAVTAPEQPVALATQPEEPQPVTAGTSAEAAPEPPVALATPSEPPAPLTTEPEKPQPAMAGTSPETALEQPATEPAPEQPAAATTPSDKPQPVMAGTSSEPATEPPAAVAPASPTVEAAAPAALATRPEPQSVPTAAPEPLTEQPAAASPTQQTAAPPPLPTEMRTEPGPPPIATLPPLVVKHAATSKDPAVSDTPPSGSWLQLAPLQDYSSAASRITPVAPRAQILSPDSGPRMTLPGPALPPDLERLQRANPVTVIGEEPHRAARPGMPGWLISLLLMIGIPIAGAVLLFYFQPVTHSSADAKAAVQEPAEPAQTSGSHPLAQLIEVTGFRIVVDYNKKSEIHYLVVNHSAADLSDMTVYVTLRAAAAKPGQPPLCRFSFKAPGLGPYESKEMTSPIEKLARSISVPDWQDLRADVQVAP